MSKELEVLENIKRDMEYVTRLDFVEPIVRGEVQQELYKIYHRETPELEIIEKALKEYELMKRASIIVNVDKEISAEDLEKIKNQRMFVGNSKQCEIKPLFDEKDIKKLKALEIIRERFGSFILMVTEDDLRISKEERELLTEVLKHD